MRLANTIYLDHQATSPIDPRVGQAMLPFAAEIFGNPHSSDHCVGWQAAEALKEATARIARSVGADPDEIIFTSGATESNNLALLGLGRRAARGKRKRILISSIEHKSVLAVGRVLEEQLGYTVETLPVDSEGFVLIPELKKRMDEDVLAVSIMAVNNEIGTIQDVSLISNITKSCGALLHSDAAQAIAAIDVRSISNNVDLLSLSGHKIYGPKGIGVLLVRRDRQVQLEPLIYGGGQQNNLRSGTLPVALCVGMSAAVDLLSTAEAAKQREILCQRRDRLIDNLQKLPWSIKVNGPKGTDRHPGNANLRFDTFSAHDILAALQPHVAAATGSACTSGIPEPSHVLRAIGLSKRQAEASIRFSLGVNTTDAEIDRATALISDALSRLPSEEA